MTKSIKLNSAIILSSKKKIDNDITKFSHIMVRVLVSTLSLCIILFSSFVLNELC